MKSIDLLLLLATVFAINLASFKKNINKQSLKKTLLNTFAISMQKTDVKKTKEEVDPENKAFFVELAWLV